LARLTKSIPKAEDGKGDGTGGTDTSDTSSTSDTSDPSNPLPSGEERHLEQGDGCIGWIGVGEGRDKESATTLAESGV